MMKEPGKRAVRTQATRINTLKEYLKTLKAVLSKSLPLDPHSKFIQTPAP
jgi:hypothetical protein